MNQKKYLKYKVKYIKLKDIYGGGHKSEINDKDMLIELISENPEYIQLASRDLKDDKDIVLNVVNKNGLLLKFASTSLKQDKKVLLTALKNNGLSIQYIFDKLKLDEEIIITAIIQNPKAFKYLPDNLQNNIDLIVKLIEINKKIYKYLNLYLIKNNKKIMKALNSTKAINFKELDGTINTISNSFNLNNLDELKNKIIEENISDNKFLNNNFNIYKISEEEDVKTLEELKINSLEQYYNEIIKFDYKDDDIIFHLIWENINLKNK